MGGMLTPWGKLGDLNLSDNALCERILAADKHQLVEGLIVENEFDRIVDAIPASLTGALMLDVETAIVDTDRMPDRWHAFVWARSREDGLRRYLQALGRRFRVWLVEFDPMAGTFFAHERREGRAIGPTGPLTSVMQELAGRQPASVEVAPAVRDPDRQRLGFWDHLSQVYGDRLGERVILPRLFLNHGVQPWFRKVWNIDRILVRGNDIWALEIKHKFPMSRGALAFGINDGELGMLGQVVESGLRCFHAIFAKPLWTDAAGAAHIFGEPELKDRVALIGVELDRRRIEAMFRGRRGSSPAHTTFSGKGRLDFRRIAASQFMRMGLLGEQDERLSRALGQALAGGALPPVTDRWLWSLRVSD